MGRMAFAVAPPNSSAETRDGKTLCEANSGGKLGAASFNDLSRRVKSTSTVSDDDGVLQKNRLFSLSAYAKLIKTITNANIWVVDEESGIVACMCHAYLYESGRRETRLRVRIEQALEGSEEHFWYRACRRRSRRRVGRLSCWW